MKRESWGVYGFFPILLTIVIAVFPLSTRAQVSQGSIFGTVKDPTGALIAGATVTIKNTGTGEARSISSDAMGQYKILDLTAGNYTITAQHQGFKTVELPQIILTVGQNARYDLDMEIGSTSQTVSVTGAQSMVDTTTPTLSATVSNRQMVDLPLNGRSFTNLAELSPGVVYATTAVPGSGVTQGKGPKLVVNGANTWGNLWYIDGTLVNDNYNKTPGSVAGLMLGVDTVQEFKTYVSTNGAALGGVGGVVDAITKSGTNSIHGDAFAFLRDKVLDSRDFFDPLSGPPPFVRKQFGGTLGGPIKKDKFFYFLGYEGFRQHSSATSNYEVPDYLSQQGYVPNSAGVRPATPLAVSPAVRNQVLPMWGALLPTASTPASAELLSNGVATGYDLMLGTQPSPLNEDYFSGRLDYVLSSKDTLFARYIFDQGSGSVYSSSTYLPNFPEVEHSKGEYLTIGETRIFSTNLVNRALFSFTRPVLQSDEGPQANPPPVSIPGQTSEYESIAITGGPTIGANAVEPVLNIQTSPQVSDDVTYTRGKHTFTFGGTYIHYAYKTNDGTFNSGTWAFPSLSSFMEGIPTSFSFMAIGSSTLRNYRQWDLATYLSDEWRTTTRITTTMGLRYEYASQPKELNGLESYLPNELYFPGPCLFTSNNVLGSPGVPYCPGTSPQDFVSGSYWPSGQDYRNIEPRFGIAWDLFGNGKTVVRPGAGIYQNMILEEFYDTWRYTLPSYIPGAMGSPSTAPLNAGCFPIPISGSNGATAACGVAPNLNGTNRIFVGNIKSPTMYRWSLDIEQQVGRNSSVSVAYVGSQGRHQPRTGYNNTATPSMTSGQPVFPGYTTAAEMHAAGCPAGGCFVASNVAVVAATPGNCFTVGNNCVANPNIGSATHVESFDGNSYYNSLQFSAVHRGKNLTMQGSYAFSKSIDDVSAIHNGDFGSDYGNLVYWADPMFNEALSAFDVRNRFVANFVYNLPGPTSSRSISREVLNGWLVAGNLSLASGSPFTTEGAFPNSSAPYQLVPNGPIYAPTNFLDPVPILYVNRVPGVPLMLRTAAHYYNPAAISNPVPGELGLFGRDQFQGPGLISLDTALIKNFQIEGRQLEFRAEAFNVINHANLEIPGASPAAFSFQKQPNGVQLLTESGTAGKILSTIVPGQGGRQIQLGLKFLF